MVWIWSASLFVVFKQSAPWVDFFFCKVAIYLNNLNSLFVFESYFNILLSITTSLSFISRCLCHAPVLQDSLDLRLWCPSQLCWCSPATPCSRGSGSSPCWCTCRSGCSRSCRSSARWLAPAVVQMTTNFNWEEQGKQWARHSLKHETGP